jgi:hypothetical protein
MRLGIFVCLQASLVIFIFSSRIGAAQVGEDIRLYLPLVVSSNGSQPPGPAWLGRVNLHRGLAGLASVAEEAYWSNGDWLHARYIVKNNVLAHSEDPGNPWYTPQGATAAQNSNLFASSSSAVSDEYAIDFWMTGPFHAVGIIDPQLANVGFGSYREADGGYQSGAGLDVLRGLGSLPDTVHFPIVWPGNGSTIHLTQFVTETPNPLTSCPSYSSPSGLPLIVQIGAGDLTPDVTAHSFRQGNTNLDHCIFDETDYTNPNSSYQSLGRSVLSMRDAIILVPRQPLNPGTSYTASITANGQVISWTFTIDNNVVSLEEFETELTEISVNINSDSP